MDRRRRRGHPGRDLTAAYTTTTVHHTRWVVRAPPSNIASGGCSSGYMHVPGYVGLFRPRARRVVRNVSKSSALPTGSQMNIAWLYHQNKVPIRVPRVSQHRSNQSFSNYFVTNSEIVSTFHHYRTNNRTITPSPEVWFHPRSTVPTPALLLTGPGSKCDLPDSAEPLHVPVLPTRQYQTERIRTVARGSRSEGVGGCASLFVVVPNPIAFPPSPLLGLSPTRPPRQPSGSTICASWRPQRAVRSV